MHKILMVSAAALMLTGCVAAGLFNQSQSEGLYTTAALVTDGAIKSGRFSPAQVGDACTGDATNYEILTSTRNVGDGVKSYAPADNAHALLQTDGARLNPAACIPPLPG